MLVVKTSKLRKIYKEGRVEVEALKGADIDIERGDFIALYGISGSGKTTLINLLGGLERPTSGVINIDGEDISAYNENSLRKMRLKKVAFIFPAFNLIPSLNAYQNMEFGLALQHIPQKERKRQVLTMLDAAGLRRHYKKFPFELSIGEQQCLAVARAALVNPSVVLADEPTSNLDAPTAQNLLDLMERFNKERGVTFIFSTHDEAVAKRGRRVIYLRDGEIVNK